MSWQATAWAAKQKTGSAAAKLTLLALANYADPDGACWPTQERLAEDTEQSIDTVQRRLKMLEKLALLTIEKREGARGQWAGRVYRLAMPVAQMSKPQSAARSGCAKAPPRPADHAAPRPSTMPHQARSPYRTAVRHKPSIEQPIEPPCANARVSAEERLQAFRGRHEGSEVVQNRIAQRIGPQGWLALGDMTDASRARLTTLERRGALDDATLNAAVRQAQSPRAPP